VAPRVFTLTDGSTTNIDAALGNVANWVIGASSHTLTDVTATPKDGQTLKIRMKYGGTFTPVFSSSFDFGTDGQPTWTSVSGKRDWVAFEWDDDSDVKMWCCQGWKLGF
jgi:hypothetical protein